MKTFVKEFEKAAAAPEEGAPLSAIAFNLLRLPFELYGLGLQKYPLLTIGGTAYLLYKRPWERFFNRDQEAGPMPGYSGGGGQFSL